MYCRGGEPENEHKPMRLAYCIQLCEQSDGSVRNLRY